MPDFRSTSGKIGSRAFFCRFADAVSYCSYFRLVEGVYTVSLT